MIYETKHWTTKGEKIETIELIDISGDLKEERHGNGSHQKNYMCLNNQVSYI